MTNLSAETDATEALWNAQDESVTWKLQRMPVTFHERCEKYVATSLELMLLVATQTANLKHHQGDNVCDNKQCSAK